MYMQRDILLLQLQKVAKNRGGAGGQARKADSQDKTTFRPHRPRYFVRYCNILN